MTSPSLSPTTPARGASYRAAGEASALGAVLGHGVNVAIWQRTLPAWVGESASQWLLTAPEGRPRFEIDYGKPDANVGGLVTAVTDPQLRAWLEADALRLGRILAGISGQDTLVSEIGPVRGDRCRKLHADYVNYRLITTYVGPGTKWLREEDLDRSALVNSPECPMEANRRILRPRRRVQWATAGHVLVLKGERAAPGQGAVHCSPAVEATGEARLVLTLTAP